MEVEADREFCFPESPNISCWIPASTVAKTLFINITLYSLSALTAILNLVIIISVSHFRQLHTPTNILLLSLAVSDFLVGLLVMPAEALLRNSCWFLGDLLCTLYVYGSYIILSASVGNMVLISVDRYLAICDPLHYSTRVTVNRVKFCVCLLWFCSFVYNNYYLYMLLLQQENDLSCNGDCPLLMHTSAADADFVVHFLLPVTVIIVLYMRVFVVAVSQARAMRSHITAVTKQISVTKTAKKSELKAGRTLGVLVVVFLVCFTPAYCVSFVGLQYMSYTALHILQYLYYFNSCLNPVIYALFYSWFRKAVKVIVTLQILQPGSCEFSVL